MCWDIPSNGIVEQLFHANTPTSVVTVSAFDAFWEAFKLTGNGKYLEKCLSIGNFFATELSKQFTKNNYLCFSYTPLDDFEVHNINLLVANALLKLGKEINNNFFCELGIQAADFTIGEQNLMDQFTIGQKQNYRDPFTIDHYHSGFEIRSLHGIWSSTNEKRFKDSFMKYYEYYYNNLMFRVNGKVIPKLTPDSIYPIDIHACAESIYLSSILGVFDERAFNDLKKLVPWVIERMKMKTGWYRYMIYKYGFIKIYSNIIYMRWGQAWMFLALTQALILFKSRKIDGFDKTK